MDTVSTARGSGWVDDQLSDITSDFKYVRLTHPLPQVVLTPSGINDFLCKASRHSFASKVKLRCWTQSVPPAVAGGLLMRRAILVLIWNPDGRPTRYRG